MFAAGALACALTLGAAGSAFAVSARPVVAPPAPNTAPPSTVYGQNGQSLPAPGITVREKKSVDQQVQDAADDLDDYENGPAQGIADPFEPWNRFWFGFNDIFYMYVADPAYKAWEAITPHQLRKGLHNFWHNLLFPVRFINNLLQLRFKEAGVEFGRFIINTTAGVGGLVDVAKNKKTIVPVDPSGEDFGQTLGRWGIPHGSSGPFSARVPCAKPSAWPATISSIRASRPATLFIPGTFPAAFPRASSSMTSIRYSRPTSTSRRRPWIRTS